MRGWFWLFVWCWWSGQRIWMSLAAGEEEEGEEGEEGGQDCRRRHRHR